MVQSAQVLNVSDTAPLKMYKGDAAYRAIEQAILLGQLLPGQSIVEQQIGRQLGCSQGTVREALLQLEQAGLVARRRSQGTVVSDMTAAETKLMVQIRIMIETLGIEFSARNITDTTIDTLYGILDRMNAAEQAKDDYARSQLDRLFHLTIIQASGLSALEPILKRCCLHIHRFTFGKALREDRPLGNRPESAVQHRAIVMALAARNSEEAARTMKEHINSVIGYWAPELK